VDVFLYAPFALRYHLHHHPDTATTRDATFYRRLRSQARRDLPLPLPAHQHILRGTYTFLKICRCAAGDAHGTACGVDVSVPPPRLPATRDVSTTALRFRAAGVPRTTTYRRIPVNPLLPTTLLQRAIRHTAVEQTAGTRRRARARCTRSAVHKRKLTTLLALRGHGTTAFLPVDTVAVLDMPWCAAANARTVL